MSTRNRDLSAFLSSRRKRLTPEDVGLPQRSHRRIPTLRREEVAWLADVGITWYTWLEQGRPIKIAAETLERVALALRLDPSETEYLRTLVHGRRQSHDPWERSVTDQVSSLVQSYSAGFALVVGPCWDVLDCNERYRDFFGVEFEATRLERNALWTMFTAERARWLFPDWVRVAGRMVAMLRLELAEYPGDRDFAELIEALMQRSADFRALWATVDVLSPARWSVGEIRDPDSGRITTVDTVNLTIPGSPGQSLVFYVPRQSALPVPAAVSATVNS